MAAEEQGKRLDSWKEIADYLGRDVRTVIRWEKEKGLPVHRLPGGKRQSVFTFTAEIDAWLWQHEGAPDTAAGDAAQSAPQPETERAARGVPRLVAVAIAGVIVLLAVGVAAWFYFARMPLRTNVQTTPVRSPEVHFDVPGRPLSFARSEIETGVQPYAFQAADFNGDGALDIAFTNNPSDAVGVLLGKGDGTFLPARILERCPQSMFMAVADFNRDTHPDIAVTCASGEKVLVLWGRGDGTFPTHSDIPIPGGPRFLAAGDFNNDGWPDLAVGAFNQPALYLALNRGGQFSAALAARFEGVGGVEAADLNGDGNLDVVAGVREHGQFGIGTYFGDGRGKLRQKGWQVLLPLFPLSINIGDLNGDGAMDLVYSLWAEHAAVSLGTARGEFSPPVTLPGTEGSGTVRNLTVTDLDLDGKLDIFLPDARSEKCLFYAGRGDGTFAPVVTSWETVGPLMMYPLVADFNHDGLPDILMNPYLQGTLVLLTADWNRNTSSAPAAGASAPPAGKKLP